MSTEMNSTERIQELEDKVAELSARVEQPTTSSRRGMLKLAAGAAAGAVAVTAVGPAGRAAAADNDPILIGTTTTTTPANDNETVAVYANTTTPPTTNGVLVGTTVATNLFTFRDNRTGVVLGSSNASSFPAALAGYAYTVVPNGIYGFTSQAGSGVVGNGGSTAIAGVNARNSNATDGAGAGLIAASTKGPNALLEPTATGKPTTGTWAVGSVLADTAGHLWYCIVAGTPGTWVDLAAYTPTFHALTPFRAYDSREAQPSPGTLGLGQSRTINIKDKRAVAGGAIVTADVVPAGATAVTANVTVVNTILSGFLTVNPGGTTEITAATVNWSGTGQILNNGVNLTINPATREVTVIAGGAPGSSTHFVIDITGYFA